MFVLLYFLFRGFHPRLEILNRYAVLAGTLRVRFKFYVFFVFFVVKFFGGVSPALEKTFGRQQAGRRGAAPSPRYRANCQ